MYDRLVGKLKASTPTLSQHKWLEDCNLRQNDINWSAAYQLASNARKEELSLLGVWTIDGKVFVKTSPEGRPLRIYSEHDLNNL